jgi:hypothetical protein
MDPTYQQAMIQALMGQSMAAPGTTGQNASTPYGQAFMTGNMSIPQGAPAAFGAQNTTASNSLAQPSTLNSSQLLQPTSTFSG